MRRLILLYLITLPVLAVDERPPSVDPVPEVPDLPLPVQSGEDMEPDITIIRKSKKTIQEYRRGGKLYMVKIIPDVGPPYYFIDSDGDGSMDVRGNDLDKGARVNMWKILEWN